MIKIIEACSSGDITSDALEQVDKYWPLWEKLRQMKHDHHWDPCCDYS